MSNLSIAPSKIDGDLTGLFTRQIWQGCWPNLMEDALRIEHIGDQHATLRYWHNLAASEATADTGQEVTVRVIERSPLQLAWEISEPFAAAIQLIHLPDSDELLLTLSSPQLCDNNLMTKVEFAAPRPVGCLPNALTAMLGSIPVQLRWHAPDAKQVSLAGEMNDWQAHSLPFAKTNDSDWLLQLYLQPGTWAYKIVQDGQWQLDTQNHAATVEGSEGANSQLSVGPLDNRYEPLSKPSKRGSLSSHKLANSDGKMRQIEVYRPAGSEGKTLPWLLALHAQGGNRNQWFAEGQVDILLDRLIAQGELPPVALVTLDAGDSYYLGDVERFIIEQLLPSASQWGLSQGPRQRGLIGVSMGGFGAHYLSYRYPDRFAAAASLSGYFGLREAAQVVEAYPSEHAPHIHYYCGEQDAVSYACNRQLELLCQGLAANFAFSAGGHNWHYWRRLLPEATKRLVKEVG
ncbi:alpha/beta hydrolase [Aliagarivorans taiwanensis]|uniref:alpha/beta hydrolase n=1 Tax=Aliagarivorans taiwanensis TaxID=561966 RepID=UPI00047C0441|nr:alpha/beta hydrolase-fold protein [Aliagarivorans taiwanensis]